MGIHLMRHGELQVALRGRAAQSVRMIKGGHRTLAEVNAEVDEAIAFFKACEDEHGHQFRKQVDPSEADDVLQKVIAQTVSDGYQ